MMLRALLVAVAILVAAATGAAAGAPACTPEDALCTAFAEGHSTAALFPDQQPRPAFIGPAVRILTPRQEERERRCLAIAAWAEARDQGPEAMAAVMWIIANRTAAAHKPSTACAVVIARGQFEPMAPAKAHKPARRTAPHRAVRRESDGDLPAREAARRVRARVKEQARVIAAGGMPAWPATDTRADERSLRLARILAWQLDGETLPDMTGGATMFFNRAAQARLGRAAPGWAVTDLHTATVGGHDFFRHISQIAPAAAAAAPQIAEEVPLEIAETY